MTHPGVNRSAKRWGPWVFKAGATVVITWMALRGIPLGSIRSGFTHLDLTWAGLSVAVIILGLAPVEAARLRCAGALLAEDQPGFARWFEIFLSSRPFFYILPAAVGAEAMVWARLRQFRWDHRSCGFVVLATRIWGMSAWSLAAALALGQFPGFGPILARAPLWAQQSGFWMAAGGTLAAASILLPVFLAGRQGVGFAPRGWKGALAIVAATLTSVLATSLSAQLASWAAGTPFTFIQSMGLLAFFNFSMVLPISLGGLGLQEALILFLGVPMGYRPEALVAFSVLLHLQRLALCGLGLGVFLTVRRNAPGTRLPA
jgi:uncharacterized membrane protein YbhN (UPF0104 family)